MEMGENRNTTWGLVGFFAVLLVLIVVASPNAEILELHESYLPVHIVLEMLGIFVSFGVFVLGRFTHRHVGSRNIIFLSLTSLAVGCFDFGHTLSFAGMPDFVTPSDPNKAIYFWLVGRVTDTVGLLWVAYSYDKDFDYKRARVPLMAAFSFWIALWFVLILKFPSDLPVMFSAQTGLSSIKVFLEWSTMLIAAVTGVAFVLHSRRVDFDYYKRVAAHLLACACFLFAMAGMFFTLYRSVDDLYNLAGHIFKLVAFFLVFKAVFLKCVSRPYAEARRLAREAATANAAKSRFLANVSHELRTPLGVISGFSELLRRKKLDEDALKWVGTIKRNSDQLKFLIDDLLDLTQVETGALTVRKEMFLVRPLVEDVVNGLRILADKKHLKLSVVLDPALDSEISSDAQRLRQILVNVIGNAIKFTAKGSVKVDVQKAGQTVLIAIEDSGIGIDEKDFSSLFQPFSQIDDSLNRSFGGSGLGLALSRKIAHLLGGNLWIERSVVGKGSVFMISIHDDSQEQRELLPQVET